MRGTRRMCDHTLAGRIATGVGVAPTGTKGADVVDFPGVAGRCQLGQLGRHRGPRRGSGHQIHTGVHKEAGASESDIWRSPTAAAPHYLPNYTYTASIPETRYEIRNDGSHFSAEAALRSSFPSGADGDEAVCGVTEVDGVNVFQQNVHMHGGERTCSQNAVSRRLSF
ncbi:hypothetical protein EYF80_051742 [Liparis tanakae]|uniref:Uncharacterized protein n=1 Tax=Liparis tanakae TaxID=230148 RepID=A0A4Z2FB20_9TELE|nr:hypothetical protein EYF80_051742 [Liparis tanakae]